jgi:hypothetical protein
LAPPAAPKTAEEPPDGLGAARGRFAWREQSRAARLPELSHPRGARHQRRAFGAGAAAMIAHRRRGHLILRGAFLGF